MIHIDSTAVQSHASDNPEYIDEQINDLHKALERAEAAIDKLRNTSKLQMTPHVQATQARPESLNALSNSGSGSPSRV
jgi:prefoldin subunit 5